MKKWMILSLVSLLLLSGCGKKPPADPAQTPDSTQQQSSGTQQQANDPQSQETPESPAPEVDMKNMTGEDLSKMIEDFNSDDISPEKKEELRLQLEEIFRQAEQQSAQ